MRCSYRPTLRFAAWASICATLIAACAACQRLADDFHRLRGTALRKNGDHAQALECYGRIHTNRQDAPLLRDIADCYEMLDDTSNLFATYRRIHALTGDIEDLENLIFLQLGREAYDQAIPDLEAMVAHAPDDWRYRSLLIEAYCAATRTNDARDALARMADALPPTASNHADMARLWAAVGDADSATAALALAVAAAPGQIEWRLALASMQTRAGDYAGALSNLDALAASSPDDPDVLQLLGFTLGEMGRRDEAVEYFRRCLRHDQLNGTALNNLAYFLLLENTNISEAFELAQSAVQVERASHTVDTLAFAHYRKGNHALALRYLKEAAQLLEAEGAGSDPELQFHFGLVYAELGKLDTALPYFREALAAQPALRALLKSERYYPVLQPRLVLPEGQ